MDIKVEPRDYHVDAVQGKLVRKVRDYSSIKAGEEEQYVQLLLLWQRVIEDLFLSWNVPIVGRPVYIRWLTKLSATNIRQLASSYGIALDILRRSENFSSFVDTFEGYMEQEGIRDLFIPLRHLMKWMPRHERDGTNWFRLITQVVSFPFRANLDAPSLDEAWIEYCRVDGECVDAPSSTMLELANAYSYLVDDGLIRTIPFRPRHGPGAIMEWSLPSNRGLKKDLRSKYALASVPQIVAYSVSRYGGTHRDYGFPARRLRAPCKFSPVPKSIGKTRTICIEPSGMQFFQQGLRDLMEDVISRSRASLHIDFKDVSRSVDMARRGSIDGSLSTVDLSNASDRISRSILSGAFSQSSLYPLLVACRSTHVTYKKETHFLRKLHTSGNGACFHTESLLFAMVCQAAIWRTRRSNPGIRTKFEFSVYGDDIVISTPCVPFLYSVLADIGAKVNESKSFVNSRFTECCGHEFFKGVDVTPLRIPRQFTLWEILNGAWYGDDVESFNQCIDLANKCKDYSLLSLRQTLIRAVFQRERLGNNPAFGPTAIHSDWSRNDHLFVHRKDTLDYQRKTYWAKRVSAVPEKDAEGTSGANGSSQTGNSDLDLLHWFVCSDLRPDDMLSYGKAVLERRAKVMTMVPFPG